MGVLFPPVEALLLCSPAMAGDLTVLADIRVVDTPGAAKTGAGGGVTLAAMR